MAIPKTTHLITIEMEATIVNYNELIAIIRNHFNTSWKISAKLSNPPKEGEIWKDGDGNMHTLENNNHCGTEFVLSDVRTKRTWTVDGKYGVDSSLSLYDLVEQVDAPILDIHPGEYWVDRDGNIHKIAKVGSVIISTLDLVWTTTGHFVLDMTHHPKDLVKQIYELPRS